jgi:hypothetical protein
MLSAAIAGFASARTGAPASQYAVLISLSLLSDAIGGLPAGDASRPFFRSDRFLLVTCFVREFLCRQQARPLVSLNVKALARTGSCTIIRRWREWQEL